jgi:DnaJ like chaperone protein
MFGQMDPKTLTYWLILAALVYLVVPFDLIPDFIGLPGRIDDIAMIGLLAWLYRSHVRKHLESGPEQEAADPAAGSGSERAEAFDAYAVLGVPRGSSRDAIRHAYRQRMREYHPDKVAHLGEALQKLAHEKAQEIQRAYQQIGG